MIQKSVVVPAGLLKNVKKVRGQVEQNLKYYSANIFDDRIEKKIFRKYLNTEGLLG